MSNVSTSPNDFDDRRLDDSELADFRCESCEGRYPFDLMADPNTQDGHKVCKVNCAYSMRTPERDLQYAEDKLRAIEITSDVTLRNADRIGSGNLYSLMDGISACTAITSGSISYPDEILLIAGGSSVSLVLTGITFTSADVLSASHTGITFGSATISSDQTSWVTTVAASGLVSSGEYDFLFNGSRFPKAFRVRG